MPPSTLPPGVANAPGATALRALAARWAAAKPAERANTALYLQELCAALGVEPPRPAGSGYEFERAITVFARDGLPTTNFVDLYKAGHFILEAKDEGAGRASEVLLRKAFGQARTYAAHDPSGAYPPHLLVLNGQRELLVWDRWAGDYGGFAAHRRVDLTRLAERPADAAFLRAVWADPASLDPRGRAQQVTEAIARKLAQLAKQLEAQGHERERVSRFLMRCVFTMFAEDVHLLPDHPFRRLLEEIALADPAEFAPGAEELWRAMDAGRRFGFRKLLRFNGHFFRNADGSPAEALPLARSDLAVLLEAARADWSDVEPAIFGTLLTRALDPVERERLGAEYTKPEFIARVVKPSVEDPIRERWAVVQADVLQLRERGRPKDRRDAEARLRDFHAWLRGLRFLDPACGSGNFLYVTLHAVKRVELEVLAELADLTGGAELRFEEVDPSQFHGIEKDRWAREIAELTLWIGFHQFWRRAHGDVQPDEPLLRDTGTLERRDAVLAHDAEVVDPARDRPDPTPRVRHPVTGALVPDRAARLPYVTYPGARPAAWPEADFIVGNPPFLGEKRQRDVLGDGYVDALRAAYPELADNTDLVAYWWHKAATAVADGRAIRAGLITTKAITQPTNRPVIEAAAARGARVVWAIADHYWNDGADDARVRVAMTVVAKDPPDATLVSVDGDARVVGTTRVPRLNADLSAHADVPGAGAVPLRANAGLTSQGYKLVGDGFLLSRAEAATALALDPANADVVKPYRNGKDLTTRPRDVSVIDFGLRSEADARRYPALFDRVRDRVRPERAAIRDARMRDRWWLFGRPRGELREALAGLPRYLATPEVSKHRFFMFLDAAVAPDGALVCVATDDAFHLGVLSSGVHRAWALAAGARMGIDATPRYTKGPCFEAFPFPAPTPAQRAAVADVAEQIHAHRDHALAAYPPATLTGLYNVVDKLRAGEALSPKERDLHAAAGCGVLRDLHDALDAAVAAAYGWAWPVPDAAVLDYLVALHDARVAEEQAGRPVRWLQPAYQVPRFGGRVDDATPPTPAAGDRLEAVNRNADGSASPPGAERNSALLPWPPDAIGQIAAVRSAVATRPATAAEVAGRFADAPRAMVGRHLETLALLGELVADADARYTLPLRVA